MFIELFGCKFPSIDSITPCQKSFILITAFHKSKNRICNHSPPWIEKIATTAKDKIHIGLMLKVCFIRILFCSISNTWSYLIYTPNEVFRLVLCLFHEKSFNLCTHIYLTMQIWFSRKNSNLDISRCFSRKMRSNDHESLKRNEESQYVFVFRK